MYTVYTSLPFETVAKIEYIWKHGRLRLVIIYIIGKPAGRDNPELAGRETCQPDKLELSVITSSEWIRPGRRKSWNLPHRGL